jgi:mRNA-degrading endonuclease RelE of RelBE toxin-antitoxin system
VRLAHEVRGHLDALTARQRSIAFDGIKRHLSDHPLEESRNRKRMRRGSRAAWELRLGELRIFYDVDVAELTVWILAVGVKLRERVRIGNEVLDHDYSKDN